MLRFDDRTVVVTGGGGGLGRGHARLLAARGAAVVVNDIGFQAVDGGARSASPAEETVREIVEAGGRAVANGDDAATEAGARRIVEQALDAFGRLDAVINNAGTLGRIPFGEMSGEAFDFLIRNHLYSAFHVTKAAWPALIRQGGGRVVMTTSGNGYFGMENIAHYCAAKAGIHGLMRSLALEGAPVGIKVNCYWPSALTRQIGATGELRERMSRTAPIEQSSPVAGWLAHEACQLNGEALHGGSGRASRVFVAETRGIIRHQLTVEDVAENIEQVMDEDGYFVFKAAIESSRAQTVMADMLRAEST